jgi:putative flippase GtrA
MFIRMRQIAPVGSRHAFGLRRLIAPTVIGFVLINGFTFAVDLTVLVSLHSGLGWPVAVSLTVAYSTAFALSYTLNRMLNFRSHGPVGRQLRIYVPIIVLNFLVFILGVGDGLTRLGVDYRLARVIAGLGEAVFMYSAMRWLVFREARAG